MSPRLASTMTSRPAARAYSDTSWSARKPSEQSASKNADCGLTATTYGPTASTIPLQKRATDDAAAARPSTASPRSSIGRRSRRGSSPTTSWLCLRATAAASRSAKFSGSGTSHRLRSLDLGKPQWDDAQLRRRPTHEAGLARRREHAQLLGTKPVELLDSGDHGLQRGDPIPQPRGVLEAEVPGEAAELRAERLQHGCEVLARVVVEGPCCELRP